MPSARSTTKSLNNISDEVLLLILQHLDPPSAVCFALANRHLYTFVSSFCKRGVQEICPRTMKNFRRAPVLLQKHRPSKTETMFYTAIEGCFTVRYSNDDFYYYDASIRLTKQYISLMLRLHGSSFLVPQAELCLQAGHLKTVFEGTTQCGICENMVKRSGFPTSWRVSGMRLRTVLQRLHKEAGWSKEDNAAWDVLFFGPKKVKALPKGWAYVA